MSRLMIYLFFNGWTGAVLFSLFNPGKGKQQQENHPPEVKILSPTENGAYTFNMQVPYTISVSDKEDGESKFDEIPSNEVLLEVMFIGDSAKAVMQKNEPVKNDHPGLAMIRTSNCLNCHAFHSPLIGPSFYDIGKRYMENDTNTELLAKHIREGSSGIWGKISMPTHPEFSAAQSKEIVKWIFQHTSAPDINYYTGTQGSFKIGSPAGSPGKGYAVLVASYTDHGEKDKPNTSLKGRDVSILQVR
jgi:cytochrome c